MVGMFGTFMTTVLVIFLLPWQSHGEDLNKKSSNSDVLESSVQDNDPKDRPVDRTIEKATEQGVKKRRNRNSKGDSTSDYKSYESPSAERSSFASADKISDRSNDRSDSFLSDGKRKIDSNDENQLPPDEISEMTVTDPTLKALEYPELQVQPSASQRVQLEIQSENSKRWLYYWPIQLSALSLLVAESKASGHYPPGNQNEGKLDDAVKIAQYTAGGWLVGTLALSTFYRPYREGAKRTRFKPTDRKQLLMKERLSEEALEDSAMLTQKLSWISVATNLGASVNLAAAAHADDRPYAVFSAVLALTPLFFKSSTVTVWERHQNYKKRIYGPLSSLHSTIVRDPQSLKYFPGIGLNIVF